MRPVRVVMSGCTLTFSDNEPSLKEACEELVARFKNTEHLGVTFTECHVLVLTEDGQEYHLDQLPITKANKEPENAERSDVG